MITELLIASANRTTDVMVYRKPGKNGMPYRNKIYRNVSKYTTKRITELLKNPTVWYDGSYLEIEYSG